MQRWLAPLAALLLGCVGDVPSNGDGGKQTGEEGGACFSDFTCKTGLVCERGPNLCRQPDGSTPADSGSGMDAATDAPSADASDGGGPCVGMTLAWWKAENMSPKNEIVLGTNILQWTGTPGYATGKVGDAFAVGGSFGWLHVTPTFMPASIGAVEMWAKIMGTGTLVHHEASGGVNVFRIDVGAVSAGFATLAITVGQGSPLTVGSVPAGPAFTHLALQILSNNFTFYVNGAVAGNGSGAPAMPSAAQLSFGANVYGMNPSSAEIDEIAMYTSLSAANISAIYAAGANGYCRLP